MIEVDFVFSSIHPWKQYRILFIGFFITANRSDEILEVGGIEIPLLQLNMN